MLVSHSHGRQFAMSQHVKSVVGKGGEGTGKGENGFISSNVPGLRLGLAGSDVGLVLFHSNVIPPGRVRSATTRWWTDALAIGRSLVVGVV